MIFDGDFEKNTNQVHLYFDLPKGTDAPLAQDAADPRVVTASAPILEPGQASAATSARLQVPLAAVPSELHFKSC